MSSKNRFPENWHYHTMKDRDEVVIWSGQYDLYSNNNDGIGQSV
jgi:hypothetical protein